MTKHSEFATPEREKQDGGLVLEVLDRTLKGDVYELRQKAKIADKMDWYYHRGTIDAGMRVSGKRVMEIMFRAGKVPKTNIMFREYIDRSPTSFDDGILRESEAKVELEALHDMLSSDETDVLWEVCCYDRHALPHRVKHLVSALHVLSVHWGNE